jgi:DegV family protein with EDD domain
VLAPVKVLVDSTAGISSELAQSWGVDVVPLYLIWDEITYRDGIDLLPTSFYSKLAQSNSNPKTSAPTPADFIAACRTALGAGHRQILIVTVTPNMSATHANASLAAREFGAETVVVLDSGQGAGAQALIAGYAAQLARAGSSLQEVAESAQAVCRYTEVFMAVNTLQYLRRSGRISGTRAALGELIQLKPILTFVDHRLQVIAKPRTLSRATNWLLEHLTRSRQYAEQVLVMYADTPDLAAKLAEQITDRLPKIQLDMSPVSGVVGGHTGPGLLGLAVRWRFQNLSYGVI